MLADCWLRAASVTSEYGEFADASELARVAMLAFVEMGDDTGTGKALFLRGIFSQRNDDHHAALEYLRSASAKVPAVLSDIHFAIHLAGGLACLDVGDVETARQHAKRAGDLGGPAPGQARLRWLRARIARAEGRRLRAIELYERVAVEISGTPTDAALVGVELSRCYLESGRLADAVTTARELAALAMPRRANRLLSSAIRVLWRVAGEGELTLEVLKPITERIRRASARRISRPAEPPRH